jgi:eukaryotic-like serine/threonine-protein kinase
VDEASIFLAALEQPSPDERAAFLDRACGGNEELRRSLEMLLKAHVKAGDFLAQAPAPVRATVDLPITEAPGTRIGPYKLLEQIGEGGMGAVWMAQQTEPVKRLVALKLIKAGMDSKQVIARFEAERQALALMDYAHIARVLDAGTTGAGRPYFVMDLVRGVPITRYCDEHHLTPRQRLELFIPVCQAVQHAHQKGVIHRDLKPSNVLVALYDGWPVPKVIDFGVAKAAGQPLTEKTLVTGFGAIVGTLEYMSPEQAEINQLDVDTRSDIYSLGVLLYELLTGSPPFTRKESERGGVLEMLRLIREQEPTRPSTKLSTAEGLPTLAANRGTEPAKLRKLVRGELDWIVMKALEKDRNRRYDTASGVAADVQRYLNDEPVQACPPSAWYRLRKFARRNKAVLLTASVVVLAVSLTGAVSSVLIWRTNQNLQQTVERERRDAYFHRIALAHRELSRDNLGRALKHLEECPPELRQWEWHYLNRLCRVEPVVLQVKTAVHSLAFSPGGEWIAAAGADGTVKVFNVKTRAVSQTLVTPSASVSSVAFHPRGKHLAAASTDGKVKVWDLTTGQAVFTGPYEAVHVHGTAYTVAFSPDGRLLAAGSDGAVKVWAWEKEQPLFTLPGHAKRDISVAFSPDSRRLASASWSGDVMIWDAVTGARLHVLSEHRHPVSALAFSPDGLRLVSAGFDRRLIVWDAATGRQFRPLEGHDGVVLGVAFSGPDGLRLASVGEDKTVRVWEAATGREVLDLRGHTDPTTCVAFSPDGLRLASASVDRTIRIWDANPLQENEAQEAFTFRQVDSEVWTMAVRPDGKWIASAGLGLGVNTPVKVWEVESGRVRYEYPGHQAVVFRGAWHPDGERIASSGWEEKRKQFVVKVWNAWTGLEAFEVVPGSETFAVAFRPPDGEYLATGRTNGDLDVWDARTGNKVGKLGAHAAGIRGLAFSRKGEYLATASIDGVVHLWDATRLGRGQTPRTITRRARVPPAAEVLAFSPDGRRLAGGGEKNTVKIWDVPSGEELHTLEGHSGDVWVTAFSPDPEGRWLASAGADSTVKVWDSQSGALLHSFRGHTALVTNLAFRPDGGRLFSGSRDKTVKVWDLTEWKAMPGR